MLHDLERLTRLPHLSPSFLPEFWDSPSPSDAIVPEKTYAPVVGTLSQRPRSRPSLHVAAHELTGNINSSHILPLIFREQASGHFALGQADGFHGSAARPIHLVRITMDPPKTVQTFYEVLVVDGTQVIEVDGKRPGTQFITQCILDLRPLTPEDSIYYKAYIPCMPKDDQPAQRVASTRELVPA